MRVACPLPHCRSCGGYAAALVSAAVSSSPSGLDPREGERARRGRREIGESPLLRGRAVISRTPKTDSAPRSRIDPRDPRVPLSAPFTRFRTTRIRERAHGPSNLPNRNTLEFSRDARRARGRSSLLDLSRLADSARRNEFLRVSSRFQIPGVERHCALPGSQRQRVNRREPENPGGRMIAYVYGSARLPAAARYLNHIGRYIRPETIGRIAASCTLETSSRISSWSGSRPSYSRSRGAPVGGEKTLAHRVRPISRAYIRKR